MPQPRHAAPVPQPRRPVHSHGVTATPPRCTATVPRHGATATPHLCTATVPQPRCRSHASPVHGHGATATPPLCTSTVPQPRRHGARRPSTTDARDTIVICEQLKPLVSHAIDFPSASVRTPLDNQARLVLVAFFWCIICVLLIIAEICRPNVRDFLMVLISKGLPRRPGVVTLGTGSSSCLLLLTYRFLA